MTLSQEARITFNNIIDYCLDYVDAKELPCHIDMWSSQEQKDFVDIFLKLVADDEELERHFRELITVELNKIDLDCLSTTELDIVVINVIMNHEWVAKAVPEFKAA